MIILGIDPGTATTGYGIIEENKGKLKAVEYGCILTPAKEDLHFRLKTISEDLKIIINQFKPDIIAVEQLYFASNVKTALAVGHARGVILLNIAESGTPLAEYTPLQVKQAISGYGKAGKKQVQEMVKILLNLSQIPKPDDAADALAIAICHANSLKFRSL
jgi:crossover junction endodeoxyribonuclease RuvC